jgi:hypothetical protein
MSCSRKDHECILMLSILYVTRGQYCCFCSSQLITHERKKKTQPPTICEKKIVNNIVDHCFYSSHSFSLICESSVLFRIHSNNDNVSISASYLFGTVMDERNKT